MSIKLNNSNNMSQNKSSYFYVSECIKYYVLMYLYNMIILVAALPMWKYLITSGPVNLIDFIILCFNFINLFILINISYYYVTGNRNESDGNTVGSVVQIATKVNFLIQIVIAWIKEKHSLLRKLNKRKQF